MKFGLLSRFDLRILLSFSCEHFIYFGIREDIFGRVEVSGGIISISITFGVFVVGGGGI